MKINAIFGILLVIALIGLTGCQQTEEEHTLNAQGTSEIIFNPDKAEVSVGISIVKDTAEEAQSEANKVVNAIIDGLRYKGISEDDIETQGLSLREERIWTKDEGSKVIGWRASQTLKVKTTDLTKVGIIVDVAVNNGANQINNINFGLTEEKEKEYKKQALSEAAKNAKEKAEILAESLGAKLGKIKAVSESNFYYRPYMYAMKDTAGALAVEEAATVMPSDVSVTAQVSVIYYIK